MGQRTLRKWVRYGYFVKRSDGILVASGSDSALTEGVFKIGDTKPGSPGKVIEIRKGEVVKQMGFNVVVIADEGE
jgi:hypothetical protein